MCSDVLCNVQWLLFQMQPEISLFLLHKNGIQKVWQVEEWQKKNFVGSNEK